MTIMLKIIRTVPRLYKPTRTLFPTGSSQHSFRSYNNSGIPETPTDKSIEILNDTFNDTRQEWDKSKKAAEAMLEKAKDDFAVINKELIKTKSDMKRLYEEVEDATFKTLFKRGLLGFAGGFLLTTAISTFLKLKNQSDLRDAEEILLTELNPAILNDQLAKLGYIPGFERFYLISNKDFYLDMLSNLFRKLSLTSERGFLLNFLLKSAVAEII